MLTFFTMLMMTAVFFAGFKKHYYASALAFPAPHLASLCFDGNDGCYHAPGKWENTENYGIKSVMEE